MKACERVSLVIPLQDEEATVSGLLDSVARQVRLPDEIILVDAGSRDATVERCLSVTLPCPLRIVRAARVFPGIARNEGVVDATSEWLAFTDGGTLLDPHWLDELAAAAEDTTDVVFGNMDPVCDTFFRESAAIAYVSPKDGRGVRGAFVASCLIRRAAFARAGGFPRFRAAEDLIFIRRLYEQEARIAFAPRALVKWQIAGDLSATFNRFALYSYHNLVAGWGQYWHLGTARLYAVLVLAIAGGLWLDGGPWLWPMLPAFFVARASKAAWIKRTSFDFATLRPSRVLTAAGVLAVIDAATAVGFFRWMLARARH